MISNSNQHDSDVVEPNRLGKTKTTEIASTQQRPEQKPAASVPKAKEQNNEKNEEKTRRPLSDKGL